jgi:hypothetical protein
MTEGFPGFFQDINVREEYIQRQGASDRRITPVLSGYLSTWIAAYSDKLPTGMRKKASTMRRGSG